MKPEDVVQPTELCLKTIYTFKSWHRGIALAFPDKFNCIMVKWHHKKKPFLMAARYIESAQILHSQPDEHQGKTNGHAISCKADSAL
jgi:hypothetical protein